MQYEKTIMAQGAGVLISQPGLHNKPCNKAVAPGAIQVNAAQMEFYSTSENLSSGG